MTLKEIIYDKPVESVAQAIRRIFRRSDKLEWFMSEQSNVNFIVYDRVNALVARVSSLEDQVKKLQNSEMSHTLKIWEENR